MRNAQARTTYLKDYQPPEFLIESTTLRFDLFEDHALVVAELAFRKNPDSVISNPDSLQLHGERLELQSLLLDDKALAETDYSVDEESLTINGLAEILGKPAESFTLICHTRIEPQNNTTLEGLYKSRKMFCTQCEAEGFRKITYYLDRPDVMSRFSTTISADKTRYPVLLSNGNPVARGDVEDDDSRHWVTWDDPFKKPSYLFALVAGDLAVIDDAFTTMSGREIHLQIFVEEKDLDKCDHAMRSLKNAMRWDEEVYGREYDLDIFMIVAVDDFNMGAMENKGLNIFNTSCVLANPATTTDFGFQRVEAVVAHEYFHNWSGNRVTCRDWFQLSLKEGFTVFRDSEFSADMGSRTVKRVEDVNFLKTVQFAEDGGPMAHSVRPDSYMEIANFYTVTIYEKGAEVVRMISLLLGPELFRAGSDLYFVRHDGQAVTTEEFVKAMEEASGKDLSQFRRWYTQAGTPKLDMAGQFNADDETFTLTVKQYTPDTPGQSNKLPLHIPLRVGLLSADGQELPLVLAGEAASTAAVQTDRVLEVTEAEQQFVFAGIKDKPIPSLLRSFSAPVKSSYDYSLDELAFLVVHDSDGFNRWSAMQSLACAVVDHCCSQGQGQAQGQEQLSADDELVATLITTVRQVLVNALDEPAVDKAMIAHLVTLPTLSFLIERATVADVDQLHRVRDTLANIVANALQEEFARCYTANVSATEFSASAEAIAQRALKNLALSYLVRTGDQKWIQQCNEQFANASNMTDQMTALRCLAHSDAVAAKPLAEKALTSFYEQWRHEALVVDQWFSVQAVSPLPGALARVKALMAHADFTLRNPNKVRSLIGTFCGQNHAAFHNLDGSGYEFLADCVLELDALNPQIAARLLTPLTRWKKYDAQRQSLMQVQLQRIKAEPTLSKDVFEVVEKSTV